MKKIIDGKTYDTETSKFIDVVSDTEYKVLYKTDNGDYFYYYENESGPDHIDPCLEKDEDPWILEVLTPYDSPITYEEWKLQQRGLTMVKDFIQNNLEHPFDEDFKVERHRDDLIIFDEKDVFKKLCINIHNGDFRVYGDFDSREYQKTYDIYENRWRLFELFKTEIGYVFDEYDFD